MRSRRAGPGRCTVGRDGKNVRTPTLRNLHRCGRRRGRRDSPNLSKESSRGTVAEGVSRARWRCTWL